MQLLIAMRLWRNLVHVRRGGYILCVKNLDIKDLCYRAMAAHDADYVEPSVELGKDWLDLEARRNCR